MVPRRPLPQKRPIHPNKDTDKLVKKAWQAKWRCVRKGNHIYCYPPGSEVPVVVKSTSSSNRDPKNLEKMFERAGLDI
jgi:hypothetical protein